MNISLKTLYSKKSSIFSFIIFLLFSFSFINNSKAHSVQVAYCVSCAGDLRIFVEHWHNTENPSSTTMTITLTVNGVPQTQSPPPQGSLINVPFGSLPGCVTPVTVAASCPGQANTYNDWVIYDYTGLPAGVPISFTIQSGNTVFTQDGCNMYPLTVNFTIPGGTSGALPDIDVCEGQATPPVQLPATATWTNNNPAIGLPASGTGSVPSFTPNPGQNATVNYYSDCDTGYFNIYTHPVPTPGFTYANTNPSNINACLGDAISFTDNSSGGTTILWDFGDGNTSTQQNPTHTYAAPGTYPVKQVVSNQYCSDSVITNVTINPIPTPAWTYTPACPNLQTTFTNNSNITTGSMTYQWNMPGATPNSSTAQNPSAAYPTGGNYNVQLIATSDMGCVDSLSQSVTIPYDPVVNFSFDTACLGFATCFQDLSTVTNSTINTWQWDYGDGSPFGNVQNPCYAYAAAGNYVVTLTATTADGCFKDTSHTITVEPEPTANFNFNDVCKYSTAQFNNTSLNGVNYLWSFGDGNTSNQQSPNHLYNAPGAYNVQLIANSTLGCSDTIVQTINIHPIPNADFTYSNVCYAVATPFTDNSNISSGTINQWNWDFGDMQSSTQQSPSHTYGSANTYNVTLITYSDQGCGDTVSKNVTVYPLPAVDFTTTNACEGSANNFMDQSTVANGGFVTNWNWDYGNGASGSGSTTSYIYPQWGTYNVQLIATTNYGCQDSLTKVVSVHPYPTVDFVADSLSSCTPLCVNFTNNSFIPQGNIAQYTWDLGNTTSNAFNPSNCYENTSLNAELYTITLTATSDSGCTTVETKPNYLTVYPLPIAAFTYTPDNPDLYYSELDFLDESLGASEWTWWFGDGGTSNIQNPTHNYADSGYYNVYLFIENVYGCKDTTNKLIRVRPIYAIWVPNTFTPDGDLINDFFFAKGWGIVEYELKIYDRWGELIYAGYDFDTAKWDGTYKGDKAKVDTYVWKIWCKDVNGVDHKYIGHVNLLR